MSDFDADDLGARGLIIHTDEGKYYYMQEKEWRAYLVPDASKLQESATLVNRRAVVGQTDEGTLVNLSKLRLHEKPNLAGEPADASAATLGKPGNDSIVIFEKVDGVDRFYAVPRKDWAVDTLTDGADSDAGVLVRRGAVVAAIPDVNVPVGTFCALINLAAIK